MLLLHYIYGDFSWYIWQCPLYGRCPLLGVSVNGESTVYHFVHVHVRSLLFGKGCQIIDFQKSSNLLVHIYVMINRNRTGSEGHA